MAAKRHVEVVIRELFDIYFNVIPHFNTCQVSLCCAYDKEITRLYSSSNPKSFWDNVKKIKGSSSIIPNSVDNTKGANEISELIADKYKKLYNSVPSIAEEQHELMSKLECDCHNKSTHNNDCYDTHKINVSHVSMAGKGIKSAKRDGTNMYTDHLINGSKHLHVHLALMYSSMLSHAFSPIQFCTSTLLAIPKNKGKSLHDSNNYRSIAKLCAW